eukprot:366022-Chlamydomonas_euryale.AAC.8
MREPTPYLPPTCMGTGFKITLDGGGGGGAASYPVSSIGLLTTQQRVAGVRLSPVLLTTLWDAVCIHPRTTHPRVIPPRRPTRPHAPIRC